MSRARLPRPIAPLIAHEPPANAAELWAQVQARRSHAQRRGRRAPVVGFALVALTVGCVAVASWLLIPTRDLERQPGPLTLADRSALPSSVQADGADRVLALADGSKIALSAGAELDLLQSSGRVFSTALRRGRARFDVRPHGPRAWRVDCGAVDVEVVGTSFELVRDAQMVAVSVQRGVVVVRGEGVPDRVQRLTAGQGLHVAPAVAADTQRAPPLAQPKPTAESTPDPKREVNGRVWREAARHAQWQVAFDKLRHDGLVEASRTTRSVEDLLLLADVARLSGHPRDAVPPLERVVREYPRDPRAALCAFTLGRIRLDTLGEPAAAALDIERALQLGLPRALAEDAQVRKVEAYARAGQSTDAQRAADAYRAAYPHGQRRADVDRISPALERAR